MEFSLHDPGYLNAHWMSRKGPFIGLPMQFLEKSEEQRRNSELVTLKLVLSKCVSVLLYGLEACPLNALDIRSLDFVINRFFYETV